MVLPPEGSFGTSSSLTEKTVLSYFARVKDRAFVLALKSSKKEEHLELLRKIKALNGVTYIEDL